MTKEQDKILTITDEWYKFRSMVAPKGATQVQLRVMRTAFFAGAFVAQLKNLEIVSKTENDEIAEMEMMKMNKEVEIEVRKNMVIGGE